MLYKKNPSQQRAADLRAANRSGMPALEPPKDGGNVPWEEPRYDPATCSVGYVEFEGRTFASLIGEIQDLRAQVRDGKRDLHCFQQQILRLGGPEE